MYQAKKASRSEFVPIRNLRYHVRVWGEPGPGKVPLFMVHGWMDVAASYQFVVDAFSRDHFIVAPDWRGYGLTQAPGTDNYWFPDYLADLDFLIDHYSPSAPIDLVGHSMGGNVSMVYAGSRPTRVRKLVNLEGFGLSSTHPSQAPERYARWMDELKRYHLGQLELASYDSVEGVARRLKKTNQRLAPDKAEWLAGHWSSREADGRWHILGHSAHKIVNANLYRVDELVEILKCICAPTLLVEAEDHGSGWGMKPAEYNERLKHIPQLRRELMPDAGHMLHHDQPERLAKLIEEFLAAP